MSLADWSNFPPCAAQCHVNVWTAQQCTLPNACGCGVCMCFANSCLCATSSWAEAVIQCVGSQCGAAAVTTAVGIAYSGCLSIGYGFPVPTAQLVSIGLAAISSSSTTILQSTTSTLNAAPTTLEATSGNESPTSTIPFVVSSPQIATNLQSTTSTLNAAPTNLEATSVIGSPTTTILYSTSTISKPASLSTGAKAGIGTGAAIIGLLFLSLISFIFYQRRQTAKLRNSQAPAGGLGEAALDNARKAELEGIGLAGADKVGMDNKNEGTILVTEGGAERCEAEAAILERGGRLSNTADIGAGLPLTTDERLELDNRRRAAELSGHGRDIPTEEGISERVELEGRRKLMYELGA